MYGGSWCYQTLHSKSPYRTLVHLMLERMDWSVTSRQLGLLVRLYQLMMQLLQGDLRPDRAEGTKEPEHQGTDEADQPADNEDGLTLGWYWSY